MKLIEPKAELYPQEDYTLEGIYKQIEKCARVSYKSEDKITDTSSKEFVDRLIKSQHLAPLEFGTVYLHIVALPQDVEYYEEIVDFYRNNPYSIVVRNNYYGTINGATSSATETFFTWEYFISTNYRVIIENHLKETLKYLCDPTEYHAKRPCVKFTTDIGTAREFTRHRVFSFMQESTRYCNYSKDKFSNEVTFVEPYWFKNAKYDIQEDFTKFLGDCEEMYIYLAQWLKPQEVRQVLPLATKTELVMCGFEDDWKHFFDLRLRGTTGAPHPDAKQVAQMTWDLFKENYGVEL